MRRSRAADAANAVDARTIAPGNPGNGPIVRLENLPKFMMDDPCSSFLLPPELVTNLAISPEHDDR
jgi:hypothetical protein